MRALAPLLGLLSAAAVAAVAWTILGDAPDVELAAGEAWLERSRAEADAPTPVAEAPAPAARAPEPATPPRPALSAAAPARRPRPTGRGDAKALLAREGGWMASLEAFAGVASQDPERTLSVLDAAWREATDPVARQNCLFHVALSLPAAVGRPWLGARRSDSASSDGDREDALCALAFSGDGAARADFVALAREPARGVAPRLLDSVHDHEALGKGGGADAAARLRSYRAIEALDREPYFEMTPHLVRGFVAWTPSGPPAFEGHAALLSAWLSRYPGHPGSDDVALRLGRLHLKEGRFVDAARWLSRASVLCDRDVTEGAVQDLLGTCEALLSLDEVRALAREPRAPNRELLEYVHGRRIALERGFDAALASVAATVTAEPEGRLADAWRARWSYAPPRGLDPAVPAGDPLRGYVAAERQASHVVTEPAGAWRSSPRPHDRTEPDAECMGLDVGRLASQLRAWETLAELERREARAAGAARAAFLYAQAAVLYHEPRSVYPAYLATTENAAWSMRGLGRHLSDPGLAGPGLDRFQRGAVSLVRAIELFGRVERDHAGWEGVDRAVFSQGLAWKRLGDHRMWVQAQDHAERTRRRDACREGALAAFDRCARLFPESPLAYDASRAAAYWRSWRPKRVER